MGFEGQEKGIQYKWSILKRAAAYVPGGRLEQKIRVLREMSPSRKIQRREIRTRANKQVNASANG